MTTPEEGRGRIPSLHDALLLSLEVSWPQAVAKLRFRKLPQIIDLSVAEVTLVECPRRLPWGRSDCVNDIEVTLGPAGVGVRLTVGMQSGDTLVIDGATIAVDQLPFGT